MLKVISKVWVFPFLHFISYNFQQCEAIIFRNNKNFYCGEQDHLK